jgi:Flp pilus assembly protein TadG
MVNAPKIRGLRRARRADGQALVEFAMVLPLLALLLFAVIQFGIVYNNYISLTDAVRAGARKAAVSRQTLDPSGPVGVTKQAVIAAGSDITISAADVTVSTPDGWNAGEDVTVTATHAYSINLFGIVVASGNLSSKTTERIE